MRYASTLLIGGIETVVVVLSLDVVPAFDPTDPQPGTYCVPDEVGLGWTRRGSGFFPPVPDAGMIPDSVERAQFKLALVELGLFDQAQALVDASSDPALKISWAERANFERSNPMIAQMAAAMGKMQADIDAVFVLAKTK